MKARVAVAVLVSLLGIARTMAADEWLPILKVGTEVYSNVTVTTVTATDIYFSHAKGMGNAKLKNLDRDLQKHFHFNATNAAAVQQRQREANARFRTELASRPTPRQAISGDESMGPAVDDDGDVIVPVHARSFRGLRAPDIIVSQWITAVPDTRGKFLLVDFWATWCAPCRESIPHLNDLAAKFKDHVVVIGISDEDAADIRKMTSPPIHFPIATDTQARTVSMVGVTSIPHALLLDPNGIVRFEGNPGYLTEDRLARLIRKYSDF